MNYKSWKKRDKFLVFGEPLLEEDEISEVVDTLRSGWIGTGPKVSQFERDFGEYKGTKHAIAVNSCTAALHLSLIVAGIGKGDEVITTALTFCATVNAIIHTGATPVLADVDRRTMNIDPQEIEKKITPKTKAILVVHFAGRPCEMSEIKDISQRHGIKLIEDCAHAIETEYEGLRAGTIGDFGCFSFYATKNVVTGEGGMILTNNDEYSSRLKSLALHGMSADAWSRYSDKGYKHYTVTELGYKYNMMDIQAAMGIHQLRRVERNWLRREKIWNQYNASFSDFPVGLPVQPAKNTRHAHHLYTIQIETAKTGISRDDFLSNLKEANIGAGVHYLSIPEHPYYQSTFGWLPEDYPNSYRIGRETISLPLSPKLTDADVNDVISATAYICRKYTL